MKNTVKAKESNKAAQVGSVSPFCITAPDIQNQAHSEYRQKLMLSAIAKVLGSVLVFVKDNGSMLVDCSKAQADKIQSAINEVVPELIKVLSFFGSEDKADPEMTAYLHEQAYLNILHNHGLCTDTPVTMHLTYESSNAIEKANTDSYEAPAQQTIHLTRSVGYDNFIQLLAAQINVMITGVEDIEISKDGGTVYPYCTTKQAKEIQRLLDYHTPKLLMSFEVLKGCRGVLGGKVRTKDDVFDAYIGHHKICWIS